MINNIVLKYCISLICIAITEHSELSIYKEKRFICHTGIVDEGSNTCPLLLHQTWRNGKGTSYVHGVPWFITTTLQSCNLLLLDVIHSYKTALIHSWWWNPQDVIIFQEALLLKGSTTSTLSYSDPASTIGTSGDKLYPNHSNYKFLKTLFCHTMLIVYFWKEMPSKKRLPP